ncbi:MAG: hypothetical protein EWM47_03090 [Anaerolineaceae bacterium]|nr:MAG: hypothetical protein EWM47_03090 [Anaerolineaceae bacterium]
MELSLYDIRLKGDIMIYIWVIIGLILFAILWSFLEHRRIVKSKYIICSNKLSKDIHGLSFVVLADLHNRSYSKNNKSLIRKILEQKPDFVIIAGDMVTKRKPCYPGMAYNLIKELSEHYPVYYAYGNHEQYFEDLAYSKNEDEYKKHIALYESWNIYKEKLKKLGVFLLDNKSIILQYNYSKITITGLSISRDFYSKGSTLSLEQDEIHGKIGSRSKESYQILIAHNPIYFSDYIKWGADLILSGHMHGGLVRLPFVGGLISPQVKLFPKYDAGQYIKNDSHMLVSRGLGSHSFMPRFFNSPELMKITLMRE